MGLIQTKGLFSKWGAPPGSPSEENRDRVVSRDAGERTSQFPSDGAFTPRAVDAHTQAGGQADGVYGEMDEDVLSERGDAERKFQREDAH